MYALAEYIYISVGIHESSLGSSFSKLNILSFHFVCCFVSIRCSCKGLSDGSLFLLFLIVACLVFVCVCVLYVVAVSYC